MGQLSVELNQLRATQDEAVHMCDALEQALVSVLEPRTPQPDSSKTIACNLVPLAEDIRNKRLVAENICSDLRSILQRIRL